MNIKPFESTIKTVFESGFYKIPRFQRPYSWDKGNIEDFWADVVQSDWADYFIGSMVFFKPKGRDEVFVVDGQQRLTTITIFLAAIRDVLMVNKEEGLAKGVQGVIQRKDINDHLRYVLLTESSYPYFQEYIQKLGNPELELSPDSEEKGMMDAYQYASSRFKHIVQVISRDPGHSEETKISAIRECLVTYRDKLLSLKAIIIELDDEDDAYVIFETLNTRGKELAPEDLVKNHLARLLPAKSADVDPTRARWTKVVEAITESGAKLDMSTYIHHFWLSREEYTPKKTLFSRIKKSITKTEEADKLLKSLETGVERYRRIFEPSTFSWKKEEDPVKGSLSALQVFGVSQPTPLVFGLLDAYYRNQLSLKQVKDTIWAIECFHFTYTAIASQSSSGGISFMYAAAARDLFNQDDPQERAKHLVEIRKKLRERIPEEAFFTAGFVDLHFTNTDSRQRPLIRYTLRRLDEHLRPDKNIDYDKMTIEHIAPQRKVATGTPDARIGNLILVSEGLNQRLRNRKFTEKKTILEEAGVPLDKKIKGATKWGEEEINERSDYLAKLAYSEVWSF